ncbi:MAG TPA: GNAT family N-acetyltransferase [Phenylobacterium sp.]
MSELAAITIRAATPADEAALGRLGALLVAVHHGFDPQRFMAATPRTEQSYGGFLASQLAEPDALVLVAEAAGEVVGYAYAGVEGTDYMALRGPAGVVYDVIVDPARRRAGIGRQLMEAAVAALVERGAPRVVLSTAERNPDAQRLFASLGFRRTMIEMTWEPPAKA